MSGAPPAKFSVVTISYNQAEFLRAAIDSVLGQEGIDLEYIICDPGSQDGSRAIIESYDDPRIVRVFEPDDGPADGLNKGFARANGEIFYYLNSDDVVMPGAFRAMRDYFAKHTTADVVCGHAYVIDGDGKRTRRVWSHPFQPYRVAVGAAVQIQPSTFIRAEAFRRAGGFDEADRSNWDGSLLTSLHLSGAKFEVFDHFLSEYRLHHASLTGSGEKLAEHHNHAKHNFERLVGRPASRWDSLAGRVLRNWRHVSHPVQTFERLSKGPLFRWSREIADLH